VAEVLVCWAVVGSVAEFLLRSRGRWVSTILAAIIASVLFGVYHFAHSPPFNTMGFVVLLTAIGLVTSVFFVVSRDVYGTIAFHNFLGIFGVLRALDASGNVTSLERPVVPLLVMAVVAIATLIVAHSRLLNGGPDRRPRVCANLRRACSPKLVEEGKRGCFGVLLRHLLGEIHVVPRSFEIEDNVGLSSIFLGKHCSRTASGSEPLKGINAAS
jgi:hypothetical protein